MKLRDVKWVSVRDLIIIIGSRMEIEGNLQEVRDRSRIN
jgi:hypothetical protein